VKARSAGDPRLILVRSRNDSNMFTSCRERGEAAQGFCGCLGHCNAARGTEMLTGRSSVVAISETLCHFALQPGQTAGRSTSLGGMDPRKNLAVKTLYYEMRWHLQSPRAAAFKSLVDVRPRCCAHQKQARYRGRLTERQRPTSGPRLPCSARPGYDACP
jgi:hypothetical protein